jgi:glycine cleavage system H protein
MKYTQTHEWISVDGEMGTVGITNHAQQELGEIVYIELPQRGKSVCAGEEVAVLESTKAAADVYSPVSGEIVAVNLSLKESPHHLNDKAETEGWLFKIKLTKPDELETLLSQEQYLQLVSKIG